MATVSASHLPGEYDELINSDSEAYGGSNVGNAGVASTEPIPSHGYSDSLRLNLPPLGFLLLKPGDVLNRRSGDQEQVFQKTKSSPYLVLLMLLVIAVAGLLRHLARSASTLRR